MATTQPTPTHDLVEDCREFLLDYYRDELGTLAQHYPKDQRSLVVSHRDLFRFDGDTAYDCLDKPDRVRGALEEALYRVDFPADVDLTGAHVRVADLPPEYTFYPGAFSPSEHEGALRAVEGEITKATDVYSRLETATFECQRCGTPVEIPQTDGALDDPHECPGCERKGPFEINHQQSTKVDGQKLRVQTPPEEAQGDGQDIDVVVEDDLVDTATVGDRVTVTGVVRLDQQGQQRANANKFEPVLDGRHIAVEQTDHREVDINPEMRERIEALAAGEEGDPLELAAQSYAPGIYGHDEVKKALILALVGGARKEITDGDFIRGEFHVLLIGDPSTGKSVLADRAETVGWRAVGVSGSGATKAGVTATAVQDDFGDGSWTLDAGAAVKSHRGVLAVDELDDMPTEVRAALLEPMSKQTIHITKGGINTHLQTRTSVVAAANPKHGRFEKHTRLIDQFEFTPTLFSRFDLVFTFTDRPDEDLDSTKADHVLSIQDAAKRNERGMDLTDEQTDPTPPIDAETLRSWIALAKQQPKPVYADPSIKAEIQDFYTTIRGMYGYDEGDPVPVTLRNLEGIVRVAEAAARFEFSETIEERHAEIAKDLVHKSMRDVGRDEDGQYDVDVVETGQSKSQRDRKREIGDVVNELQAESDDGSVSRDAVVEALSETYDAGQVGHDLDKMLENGVLSEPSTGELRFLGWR